MRLSDKICITFDIEVLSNCFICSVYNTETDEITTFEISERTNNITNLHKFFTEQDTYFVGYNCIHYDTPILNQIFYHYKYDDVDDYITLTKLAFEFSSDIISKENSMDETFNKIFKRFKYMKIFEQIDLLTMLYSQALRVSLKWMQVTMHYENVLEMSINWFKPIELHQIDTLIEYNINDIKSTAALLDRCKNDLLLRIDIEERYGINCLSKDSVRIGVDILANEICDTTDLLRSELEKLRSPASHIPLKDVILPWITFECKEFKGILENMKTQIISDGRKVLEYKTIYNGLEYSVGVGGLHSINRPSIIKPKEDEILIDLDAASLYPSLIIEHGFGPRHLGKTFIDIYSGIKDERIEAKHKGDKLKDQTLKLLLNSVTGNLGNEYSWMYDPFAVLQIRINGQLMFLMLSERLTNIGCTIVSANTDGLTVRVPKAKIDDYYRICAEWEKLTSLVLEHVEYTAVYVKAVNDYIAVKKDGKTKEKGLFITQTLLGKGLSPEIIPIALKNYFVNHVPVKETIKNAKDIKQFLIGEKTGKQWTVEYLSVPVQQVNRYYVSVSGAYLDKKKQVKPHLEKHPAYGDIMVKESVSRMNSKPVQILNKFDNRSIEDYKIDYQYYISECNKIIWDIEPRQLTLF